MEEHRRKKLLRKQIKQVKTLDGTNGSYLFVQDVPLPFWLGKHAWYHFDTPAPSPRLFEFKSEEMYRRICKIGIKKIVCGSNDMFILLNDGTALGNGPKFEHQTITTNAESFEEIPLSNIENIYCGDKFRYFLIREPNNKFRMVSSGIGGTKCLSQRNESEECEFGNVYYWDNTFEELLQFPPPNEIVLDAKCGNENAVILAKHSKNNQRYLYTIGESDSHLQKTKLSSQFDTADYLMVQGRKVLAHSSDGNSIDWSMYINIETFHQLTEITFSNITVTGKLATLSCGGISLFNENSIYFHELLTELDKERYLTDSNLFRFHVSSCQGILLILIKRNIPITKEVTRFKELIQKKSFHDLIFKLSDSNNEDISKEQYETKEIVKPSSSAPKSSLGSIGSFFLFSNPSQKK